MEHEDTFFDRDLIENYSSSYRDSLYDDDEYGRNDDTYESLAYKHYA